jgi:hypothetical protein
VGFFKRKPKVHAVAVYDTRPLADDPKPFEPYFVAICECGWVGVRQGLERGGVQ